MIEELEGDEIVFEEGIVDLDFEVEFESDGFVVVSMVDLHVVDLLGDEVQCLTLIQSPECFHFLALNFNGLIQTIVLRQFVHSHLHHQSVLHFPQRVHRIQRHPYHRIIHQ